MIYLALGELFIIAGLVVFIGRRESEHAKTIIDLIEHQDAERSELLTRIQRPDLVPVRQKAVTQRPPSEAERQAAKAFAQVGTVSAPSNG